jgi:ZipA, C-terminal FtsZ-binding domain
MGDSLQIGLIVVGVVVVGAVYVFNLYQDRIARRRLESAFSPKTQTQNETPPPQVVSIQESLGDGIPLRGMPSANASMSYATAMNSSHSTSEVLSETRVVEENHFESITTSEALSTLLPTSSADQHTLPNTSAITQTVTELSETHKESADYPHKPSANKGFQPDALPMPPVDLLIESVTRIVTPEPVSPSVLQAAMTIPMAKPVIWLGWNESRQQWERFVPQALTEGYRVIIASLLLADRQGALNEVQLNTFYRLIENLANNGNGQCDLPRLETELQRAQQLDRKCADMDIQINISVLRSPQQGSMAATRLRGVAEACGFRWTKQGYFEFLDEQNENILFTMSNHQPDQPFSPETLHTMQTHGVSLILDVPNVSDPLKAFDQMRSIAKRLSLTLDAALVDDQRRSINEGSFSAIRHTIEQTVELMKTQQIIPGSLRTLRLFA